MYYNLISLVPSRIDFRIRVRVTRTWPTINHSGDVSHQNLVLLDTENYHVHAYVSPPKWSELQNIVQEGNMYIFEKFQVREAFGRFRPVSSPLCIVLHSDTTVTPIIRYFPAIPRHKFEFVPVEDLFGLAVAAENENCQKYATDIIGVVTDLEPVFNLQTVYGPRSCARFRLYDGSISVKVNVWNNQTSELNPLYHGNEQSPVVILAGVKARAYKDFVIVSTLPQTKIYINLPIDEVAIVRQRILDVGNNIPADDGYDRLKHLDLSRSNWTIRIRVTRMWPSISLDNVRIHGYNFIFIDNENHHVHAFSLTEDWNKFASVILEGRMYEISNFYTIEAKGRLRPVSSWIKIFFNDDTTVKRILNDDHNVPSHKFEFIPLGELYDYFSSYGSNDVPHNAIDVFGYVENLEEITKMNNEYVNKRVVQFTLSDGRYKIKTMVWYPHINSLLPLFETHNDKPTILILSSITANIIEDSICIYTLPFSRIYIDLDHKECNILRQSICGTLKEKKS